MEVFISVMTVAAAFSCLFALTLSEYRDYRKRAKHKKPQVVRATKGEVRRQ